MRTKRIGIAAFIALSLCATSLAGYKKYQVVGGPKDFYFGHISYAETDPAGGGSLIIREGAAAPEAAEVNSPLGPGDTVRTPDDLRCEIQFDTGTIVRLDAATELKIETVFARSLSSSKGLTNLVVGRGRVYVMYREYDSREVFQVLTPNAAVKFGHRTVAMIKSSVDGVTDVQVKAGKASALFGTSANDPRDKAVRKLERLIILGDGQFQIADYVADTDFEKWNDEINANFEDTHEGKSALPKPIQSLPDAVVYFAQKYGNIYGEWVWEDFLGYVWRPYARGEYWQPYAAGHWTSAANQLFWIPDEPWGWVPYHLGIWHWDKKLGWVWLPGSLFASAWTEWDFFYGHFSWRPWGFFDWYGLDELTAGLLSPYYLEMAGIWPPGGGPSNYGDWNWWNPQTGGNKLVTRITKDQLKKGEVHALPMPKELKKAYHSFVAAIQRKDDRALDSLKHLADKTVFARESDIRSTRLASKLLTSAQVRQTEAPRATGPAPGVIRNSHRDALRVFGLSRAPESSLQTGRGIGFPVAPGPEGASFSGAGTRFRDWNPDIRIARQLGVSINYSSQQNVIRCPELRFSSRDVSQFGARLSALGVWSPFGGGADSSGASNGQANSGPGASQVHHGGGHEGGGQHQGGGGGSDVKKN